MVNEYFSFTQPQNHKKKIIIALILSFTLIVGSVYLLARSNNSLIISEYELEIEEFNLFIKEHNKIYQDEAEFYSRFSAFRENLAYIRVFNSLKNDYVIGKTCFADMTLAEFKKVYLKETPQSLKSHIETPIVSQVPQSVNWVAKGAVTPVINQGQIGSPVDITIAGSVESAWFIAGHPLVALSYQELFDCSSQQVVEQCYQFIVAHGLTSLANYPSGSQRTCNQAKVAQPVAKISSYAAVTPNSPTALETAIAYGPTVTLVDASSFQLYTGGTITSGCGTSLNHAVLAVGYNLAPSVPYYTVKNSWGASWGMSGYAQIGIANGPGICGIQISPYYPKV